MSMPPWHPYLAAHDNPWANLGTYHSIGIDLLTLRISGDWPASPRQFDKIKGPCSLLGNSNRHLPTMIQA